MSVAGNKTYTLMVNSLARILFAQTALLFANFNLILFVNNLFPLQQPCIRKFENFDTNQILQKEG